MKYLFKKIRAKNHSSRLPLHFRECLFKKNIIQYFFKTNIKMDVYDIPEDIARKFLDDEYPDLSYNDANLYDVLLDLILSGNIEYSPNEITNWIISYNNRNNADIKTVRISDILLDKVDLQELYQIFNVNTKEDLIQILSYLHKLDDDLTIFNSLPVEILKKILIDVDIDSLLLWFKLNTYLNYSDKLYLDDILRRKIALASDIKTEDLSREQLIYLINVIEKEQYYGSIKNNRFKIFDRKINYDRLLKSFDKRLLSNGKDCNTYEINELIEILWSINGPLPDNSIILTKDNREDIMDQLSGNTIMVMDNGKIKYGLNMNIGDMEKWDLEKLEFIYNWIRSNPKKSDLCNIIKDTMTELEIIKYL